MREIIIDTETTGLSPSGGHRVVEIGCVELINRIPSGRDWHTYLNPERDVPEQATKVHGLTYDFLREKRRFAEIVDELLEFIGNAPIVAHNASFDFGFLNYELSLLSRPALLNQMIDTLALARRKLPGSPATLDALCRKFGIDTTARSFHGALVDCELLAGVYLELMGGRQAQLSFKSEQALLAYKAAPAMQRPRPLAPRLTEEEIEAHEAFIGTLGIDAVIAWQSARA
jgi:DNA polymerase-3 subunit epsilon